MFRIGEFSKIAQVSGRLLRFYDEIGLLSPDFTDPQTGYRYYSAGQLPRLNRILVLKELGLSLEQIAQFLERDVSMDEIREMLTLRKVEIERSLQEETSRLRMVETRLQQIDVHGQIEEPDVVLKSIAAQQFLSIREVLPNMSAVQGRVRKVADVVSGTVGEDCLDHLAVVIHSPVYEPDAFDVEIGYLFTGKAPKPVSFSEDRMLTFRELPAVETIIGVDIWRKAPLVMFLTLPGLQFIAPAFWNLADLEGMSLWVRLRHIVLPHLRLLLLTIALLLIGDALATSESILILTGGGPASETITPGLYSYNQAINVFNWVGGATSAWLIAAAVLLVGVIYLILVRQEAA